MFRKMILNAWPNTQNVFGIAPGEIVQITELKTSKDLKLSSIK
jgi:hypothetical protein